MSACHIAIAWFCDDLYIRARAWGSRAYCGYTNLASGPATVIDLSGIGFGSERFSSSPHLFSCQIVLPSGEPNVVYLIYNSSWPNSCFEGRYPAIGVQCLDLSPLHAGETYYNLSWDLSTDIFSSMRKLKFTIGTGTDPSSSDTDGDYELDCGSGSLPANVVVQDPDGLFDGCDDGEVFTAAGKVATISAYAVTDVTICRPDDSAWAEIEESRVVLDDEALRIKITIAPQLQSLAQCCQMFGNSLVVKTSGTCPSGAFVPIGDDASLVSSSGKSEIRISKTSQQLKTLGLLPQNDNDGVDEMAWLNVPETSGQNLSDRQLGITTCFLVLG